MGARPRGPSGVPTCGVLGVSGASLSVVAIPAGPWASNLVINAPVMVFIHPAAGEPLGVDRFPRGSSAAGAGTAANAAACRLVHPTRPIRPAAGANGPVVGGPATQKGGWRISFTPRSAPLLFRSGAMTPFPGRAGAAAHPKVKRQPPFSVPAAVPDHDYGAVGREITPARPRRWLRGSATSPVPGHRDAAPLPAAAPPLSAGPNTSVVCATYNLQPTSALWAALVICASGGRAWRCASTWTLRPPTGPSRGAAGPAVLAESADAAGPASGGQRRRRGAPRA